MTEYEINKAVADKLGIRYEVKNINSLFLSGEYGCSCFDPCNNAQQAWDIIYNFKIDISFGDDVHQALKGCTMAIKGDKSITSDKPFVAAMLLFLEI